MKTVNAFWEKRNLGISVAEISVEGKDLPEDVKSELGKASSYDYVVVKIPSNHIGAMLCAEESGYTFMESALKLSISPQKMKVDPRFAGIVEKCSYAVMNDDEYDHMVTEVRAGIFCTDRIYNDPHFTHKQAAERYVNWLNDLRLAGDPVVKVEYNGKTIGFFACKAVSEDIYDGLLAGVYTSFTGSGLGYLIQWAGIDYARQRGAGKYIGHISLSNPEVLKIMMSLGYNVTSAEYVFVKHNRR